MNHCSSMRRGHHCFISCSLYAVGCGDPVVIVLYYSSFLSSACGAVKKYFCSKEILSNIFIPHLPEYNKNIMLHPPSISITQYVPLQLFQIPFRLHEYPSCLIVWPISKYGYIGFFQKSSTYYNITFL